MTKSFPPCPPSISLILSLPLRSPVLLHQSRDLPTLLVSAAPSMWRFICLLGPQTPHFPGSLTLPSLAELHLQKVGKPRDPALPCTPAAVSHPRARLPCRRHRAPRPGRGGRREGRACQVRRGQPGPLTSAQVREGRRRALTPVRLLWIPPSSLLDQVKRGSRLCGCVLQMGLLRLEASRGQLPGAGARRDPPPVLREKVALETRAPRGARLGLWKVRGAPPGSTRVTPSWPSPLRVGFAGGCPPRTRPASAGPGGRQISAHFCSRSGRDQILLPGRCLRCAPRAGRSLPSTGDGESEQVVACLRGPEREGGFTPQRRGDLAPAPSGRLVGT